MQKTMETEAKKVILAQCAVWEALGINAVVCTYSGYGDEGSINDFEIQPNTISQEQAGIGDWRDPIYAAFDSLTFANVTGNNEGGGGSITVDVKAQTITRSEYYNVEHQEYVGDEEL